MRSLGAILSSTNFNGSKLLTYMLIGGLAGCASSGPILEPDATTYPRDLVRERNVTMVTPLAALGAGINAGIVSKKGNQDIARHQTASVGKPTFEIKQTEVGDSAVHEVRIPPESVNAMDQTALYNRIPQAAEEACGAEYHVTSWKYYQGTEATSKMMGINHPWMSAKIRCPLKIDIEPNGIDAAVEEASKEIESAQYFDIHQKEFSVSSDRLVEVIKSVLGTIELPINKEYNNENGLIFVTEGKSVGPFLTSTYQQLAAVVTSTPNGSILAFRLAVQSHNGAGLVAVRRDSAYKHANRFLGDIAAQINASEI